MPKSGEHRVNTIDSFFRVRPSSKNLRDGESVSFLEDGKLIKQEKRNGVVYETKYAEQGKTEKVSAGTTTTIIQGSSQSGDITSVTAGTGLSGGGNSGPITLNIDSTVATLTGTQTLTNKTLTAPTLTGTAQGANLTLTGDLTVGGTTTTLNAQNLQVKDKNIVLNYLDGDSSSTADGAGITIQDGVNSSTDATILWDQDPGEFDFSHRITAPSFVGDVTGDLTGNADTATALATARSITMSGEVSSGAVNFDGTAGVVIPNTTIGSGVISDGNIASDAAIATSKLFANTISGVALGSNLNALTVGTGMAFASGSNYTGATARQINLNLSAIDHDSLGNYVANEHIDWTIDQGATNIHAGNYTDTNTNQLTTFTATDGGSQSVTIAQGKYWKFKNGAGVDVEFTDSNGGGSGDPFDLTFKLDLSTVNQLPQNVVSGDNFLVYNSTDGTALATLSEIQDALSIPSASGTTDGVVTLNANGTLTGESGLTYDTSTLAVTGDQTLSGVLKHSATGNNRLTLDDDSGTGNEVTLASANNVNILIDNTNNGTGDFQVRARPTTANDLDTASMILDMDKATATFNQDTSQQFQIGGANRLKILETGTYLQNSSLGVGIAPLSENARIQATNHIEAGVGSGAIGLTINDGGGNSNVTFNHTERIPEQNGNSGRIEVNTDGVGGQYMAFELAGNVTSGVTVATTEIARINATGLQSSLSGTAASPALRVNDTDTGLYRIADDKLGISTAGTFAVAVDASQNVGIGTSTPEGKVHIYNGDASVAPDSDGDELVVENSGDSGISILSGESSTHTGAVIFGSANDAFGAALQYSYHGNKLRLMTANTGHKLEFATDNNTTAMTIDSSQNVGIGEVSPSVKMQVSDTSSNCFIRVKGGTGNFAGIDFGDNDDDDISRIRHSNSDNSLRFSTNNTEKMRIDSSGNVAINQGNRFYLDGVAASGDTYIQSDSADNLRFVVGNRNMIEMIENDTDPDQVVIGNVDFIVEDDAGVAVLTVDSSTSKTTLHSLDVTNALTAGSFEVTTLKVANIQYTDGDSAITIANGGGVSLANGLTVDSGAVAFNGGLDMNENNISNVAHLGVDKIFGDADTDTQINFDGSDVMTFDTGNAEAMRINASQNVGIGTNSPGAKLEISNDVGHAQNTLLVIKSDDPNGDQGASSTADIDFHIWDSNTRLSTPQARIGVVGNGTANQNSEAGGQLAFYTNVASYSSPSLTERMRIDASGNVGIGTTSPADKMHVYLSGSGTGLRLQGAGGQTSIRYQNDAQSWYAGINSSEQFYWYGSQIAGTAGFINTNGNLYWNHNILLSVNHKYLYSRDTNGALTRMFGMNSGNTTYIGPIDSYAGGSIVYGISSNVVDQVFYTSGSERLRIKATTGNVGIGTDSPDAKLEVNGGTNSDLFSLEGAGSSFKLIAESGSTGSADIMAYRLGLRYGSNDNGFIDFYRGPDGATGYLAFGASGAEKMRLDRFGNVGIGTVSPDQLLDLQADPPVLQLTNSRNGAWTSGDEIAQINFHSNDASGIGAHSVGFIKMITGTGSTSLGGEMTFGTGDYNTAATERMRIDEDGNVGIGTTSPDSKLEVSGSGVTALKITGSYPILYFDDADTGAYIANNANGLFIGKTNSPSSTNDILKLDLTNSKLVTAGGYFEIGGGSSITGILGFNRNISTGAIHNASYGAYQMQNEGGTFRIQVYNSSGGSVDANAFVIKDTARVGIGTASPALSYANRGLEIQSTDEQVSLRLERTGSSPNVLEISTRNSDTLIYNVGTARAMRFGMAGTEYMRFATNGRFIVGSNYTTNASTQLVVSSSGANGILLNNDNGATQNSGRLFFEGTSTSAIFQSGTALSFRSGATTGSSSGTQQMYINSSGALFTNDVNVDGHVTLQAGHYFTAHNESAYGKYRMYGGSSTYAIGMKSGNTYGGLGDWAMTFTFNNDADRGFLWRHSGMAIDEGAMGLTTGGKLNLAHSARIGYGIGDGTTPGATYALDVSGSIGATADVVAYVSSDKRLKDNIKNIANPLEKLEKLNGVEFDWNDKQDLYEGHDIGVIAQEVEEVLPEIVDTRQDGHKAVKYDRMVALLIEAVKEQQQQINELKEKLNV